MGGSGTMTGGKGGGTSGTGTGGTTAGTSGGGGTAGSAPPAGMCATADVKEGMCKANANGIFAIKTVLDVWWQDEKNNGTPIVDPARGPLTIYLMGDLQDVCPDGSGGVGIMKACGSELPPFTSDVTCDAYQLLFPDEMWDKPTMPKFMTGGSTSGFNPGDILTLAKATGLVGVKLSADNAAWPSSTETGTFACGGTDKGEMCFPDADGDGQPGVTVKLKTSGQYKASGCGLGGSNPFTYRGSPTSLDVGAAGGTGAGIRAAEVHIGLRTILGGAGAIGDDCKSGVGDAQAESIESRAVSCKVDPASVEDPTGRPADNDCTAPEAQFVDDNVPHYIVLQKGEKPPADGLNFALAHQGDMLDQTPSAGPRASIVRLGDTGGTFTCVDVRAAAFPMP